MSSSSEITNSVLETMAVLLEANKPALLQANQKDLQAFGSEDQAMYDRLKMNEAKIDGMKSSLGLVSQQDYPVGKVISEYHHENGLRIVNRTAPFGTIMIIYESRPDVTIEAAAIAFKSGNKIKLKGGKESINSNLKLVELWHQALIQHDLKTDWIEYLSLSRTETQDYLKNPKDKIDLIVPRGGEGLINFVKSHATCPVLVSGRGNNFLYIDSEANLSMAKEIVLNAKTTKISACNALDKLLVHESHKASGFYNEITQVLESAGVEVNACQTGPAEFPFELWQEEFLKMKILMSPIANIDLAIDFINKNSGGHSVSIITDNFSTAEDFMRRIDAAAVYHNASTRFTDGGQFGMGAELAISTDKLHHRGPLGIEELVTNKWYIHGAGQIR